MVSETAALVKIDADKEEMKMNHVSLLGIRQAVPLYIAERHPRYICPRSGDCFARLTSLMSLCLNNRE